MAKFLPFIVEKSTPVYVYQTLLARSKGMNKILIASVFNMVEQMGITKVRRAAADLPEMETGKLYESLISQFPETRISNEAYKKIQSLAPFIGMYAKDDITPELLDFSITDMMSFFLVIILCEGQVTQYLDLPIERVLLEEATQAESSLKQFGLFSNDGIPAKFQSKDALKAYVVFFGLIYNIKPAPIMAVLAFDPTTEGRREENAAPQI